MSGKTVKLARRIIERGKRRIWKEAFDEIREEKLFTRIKIAWWIVKGKKK